MLVDAVGRQRLNAGKDVLPAFGSCTTDIELAEVGVTQDLAVGPQGLLEDLATVRHEEQLGVARAASQSSR